MRFGFYHHILFDQVRLEYDTVDIARLSRRWPLTEFKMAVTEPEGKITVDRNELTTRFQRLPQHLRRC